MTNLTIACVVVHTATVAGGVEDKIRVVVGVITHNQTYRSKVIRSSGG
jgi:hypothetical protein